MHYIKIENPGANSVLSLASMDTPTPKSHEILIRISAAGVNRADLMQRDGKYSLPRDANPILGLEVAGEIVGLGEAVNTLKLGDMVCALTNGGGYAEYVCVPAGQCLPFPRNYDAIHAAALPEAFFTVWSNIFQMARLAPHEILLVHGGTSGIGVTAIKLAHYFKNRVFATAGSKEKCDACLAFGAELAINYREQPFEECIAHHTNRTGVDVILDMVGAPYLMPNVRSLKLGGRLVEIATQQGNIANDFDLNYVIGKRLSITGSALRPRSSEEKAAIARELYDKVWPILDAGHCKPEIAAVFKLAQATKAQALMQSSQHQGKIVLTC